MAWHTDVPHLYIRAPRNSASRECSTCVNDSCVKHRNENEVGGLWSMVRAFRHRNFRLYFGGQSISLIGTWVQQIALSWTIYQLTHSSFLLGLVSFAGQLPLFILTPFAGVVVDRFNRHRIIIATQTLALVQAFVLAVVVSTGALQVWNLI